ncbi:MAG: hypothetical protein ACRDVE_05335 [Actinocrinis sp.]
MFASLSSWRSRPAPSPRPVDASPLAGHYEHPTSEPVKPAVPLPGSVHADAEAAAVRAAVRPAPAPAPQRRPGIGLSGVLPLAHCDADRHLMRAIDADRRRVELVNDELRAANRRLTAELRGTAGT